MVRIDTYNRILRHVEKEELAERIKFFRQAQLTSSLDEQSCVVLESIKKIVLLKNSETVYDYQQNPEHVYLVKQGEVAIKCKVTLAQVASRRKQLKSQVNKDFLAKLNQSIAKNYTVAAILFQGRHRTGSRPLHGAGRADLRRLRSLQGRKKEPQGAGHLLLNRNLGNLQV